MSLTRQMMNNLPFTRGRSCHIARERIRFDTMIFRLTALALLWAFSSFSSPRSGLPGARVEGFNLEAPPAAFDPSAFDEIKALGAEWVSVIPYAFSVPGQTEVWFNSERQWWGETVEGYTQTIRWAHEKGLKVMLKPQIWIRNQGWAGDFMIEDAQKAREWMRNYGHYILQCAGVARDEGVELFCFSTEFRKMVENYPQLWNTLIDEIREIYKGPLTYAANWDSYRNLSIWSRLDYIGIDAYFPLETSDPPDVRKIMKAWLPWKKEMKNFAAKTGKAVLFTEFGYKSVKNSHHGHWKELGDVPDEHIQAMSYEALFRSFYPESWWKGGMAWKWFLHDLDHRWANRKTGFSPQGKASEEVLKKWWLR